ncbi:hypothetical protein SAMN04488112_11099 [Melghirimyces thermohalophilus]|uniref:Uncharacterized protein n=1 Tax=Melghirimyces thermohalophilus TaxID=1236220 RepID=A0A1G6MPQ8_9BACL|nr:hypothetical protein [Melghirimyces thermohalophilus]SDC57509.1 hypothetical protein SAMN04488112_11099 [Melghirimyces thermohalophilus]
MEPLYCTSWGRVEELKRVEGLLPRIGVSVSELLVFVPLEQKLVRVSETKEERVPLEPLHREIHFVQTLPDQRYLLVSAFSGNEGEPNAFVYDREGNRLHSFSVGDGVEDVQTVGGRIWIGYTEDGINGEHPLSQQGLVCLDQEGHLLFSYRQAAQRQGLPEIWDCYAFNAFPSGETWVYYYADHLMARLDGFQIQQFWKGGPVLNWRSPLNRAGGFVLRNRQLLFATPRREVYRASLGQSSLERLKPVDREGKEIRFDRYWTRDSRLFFMQGADVYLADLNSRRSLNR